jgi:hypothetical protein
MLDKVKYPYMSMMLGQLILKQQITEELEEEFYKELQLVDSTRDFHDMVGMASYYMLKSIGGCPDINDVNNRAFLLDEIKYAMVEVTDIDKSDKNEPNSS